MRVESFPCAACEGFLSFGYSLSVSDVAFPGSIGFMSSVTSSFMEILDDVRIIVDPYFVTKIEGLSALEYYRTLQTMEALRRDISLVSNLDRRQFEQVTAELFRVKGFSVEITKKTRDGGRDIIGIANVSGVHFKTFIECKRKDPGNAIGVDIVRSVYGVHNSRNGPNKSIIVGTTYFTKDALNFRRQETNSSWELDLYDFSDISQWIAAYR